jgi:hypothetical protein
MNIGDTPIIQDPDYVRVQYSTGTGTGTEFPPTILPPSGAVTTINGVAGPVIDLDGGVTGYSFTIGGNPITLQGSAKSIEESSGPTSLDIGAIADGDFLKRSGTTIVGGTPGATTLNVITITSADSPYALTDANDVVLVDTSGADVTVTLHDPTTAEEKPYRIKMIVTGNDMILDGDGANVDGNPTVTTNVVYTAYEIIPSNADGEWFIF